MSQELCFWSLVTETHLAIFSKVDTCFYTIRRIECKLTPCFPNRENNAYDTKLEYHKHDHEQLNLFLSHVGVFNECCFGGVRCK